MKDVIPKISTILNRPIPPAPDLTGDAYIRRLSVTIAEVFRRSQNPTVLILEDLHWMGEEVPPILQHLLRVLEQLPHLLIVGSYRHDERPGLPTELGVTEDILRLERLANTAVTNLVQAMLGKEAGQQTDLINLLIQESEGNTFFLVEITRTLAQYAGRLSEVVGMVELPQQIMTGGMQALLQRKLNQIPEPYRNLLALSAVVGRQLDEKVLAQLGSESQIDAWIRVGEATQILTLQGGNWQFTHDKLREAVLGNLSADRRCILHGEVAQAIETIYVDNTAYNHVILEHWHQANNLDKELEYLSPVAQHIIHYSAEYSLAQRLLERTLPRIPADDARQAHLLNLLASTLQSLLKHDESKAYAQQALTIAQQVNDLQEEATSFYHLGLICTSQGDYEQAKKYSLQSLDIHQTIGDKPGIASIFNLLGNIANFQGNFEQAKEYSLQSLTILQAIGEQRRIGLVLGTLGSTAFYQGDYEQAKDYFLQSLAIRQSLGDQHGLTLCFHNLGTVAKRQGKYEIAKEYLLKSLTIRQNIGDKLGMGIAFNNLGNIAIEQGHYELAQEYHLKSLAIRQAVGDKRGIALGFTNLGEVTHLQGDYEAAKEYLLQGLALRQAIGDQYGTALTQNYLGETLAMLGEYEQAEECFLQSLAINKEINSKSGMGYTLIALGNAASRQGEFEMAKDYYSQSLTISEEVGERLNMAKSLNGLGDIAQHQTDLGSAKRYYLQSLDISRELEENMRIAHSVNGLAKLAYEEQDYRKAENVIQESISIYEAMSPTLGGANSQTILGFIYLRMNNERASDCFHQALKTAHLLQDKIIMVEDLLGFACVYGRRQQFEEARQLYQASRGEVEQNYPTLKRRLAEVLAFTSQITQNEVVFQTVDEPTVDEPLEARELNELVEQVLAQFGLEE